MRDVRGILQEALTIEHDGEAFYRRGAETCHNPVARRTFLELAAVEKQHAGYFQAYYDAMAQTQQWPASSPVELAHHEVPAMAKAIYDQARCEAEECEVVMCAELHQLYEAAMDKERAAGSHGARAGGVRGAAGTGAADALQSSRQPGEPVLGAGAAELGRAAVGLQPGDAGAVPGAVPGAGRGIAVLLGRPGPRAALVRAQLRLSGDQPGPGEPDSAVS